MTPIIPDVNIFSSIPSRMGRIVKYDYRVKHL